MPKRSAAEQEAIGKLLSELGMTMGVFVAFADWKSADFVTKSDKDYRQHLKKTAREAVDIAKRCGAKWCTVVPGLFNQKLEPDYQTANCVDNLKVMAEVCQPAGLVMVLEPLNWYANHPGLYLSKIPQAYLICRSVDSPSVKILDDLYHQQISEGNLIPNMDFAWEEIAYLQTGDNPGRKEPTTGEINYRNIFKWLHEKKKFDGVIGMEHGLSQGGKQGEQALIAAYRWCDGF
jgi:hydroxypyruvate isomerase